MENMLVAAISRDTVQRNRSKGGMQSAVARGDRPPAGKSDDERFIFIDVMCAMCSDPMTPEERAMMIKPYTEQSQ